MDQTTVKVQQAATSMAIVELLAITKGTIYQIQVSVQLAVAKDKTFQILPSFLVAMDTTEVHSFHLGLPASSSCRWQADKIKEGCQQVVAKGISFQNCFDQATQQSFPMDTFQLHWPTRHWLLVHSYFRPGVAVSAASSC